MRGTSVALSGCACYPLTNPRPLLEITNVINCLSFFRLGHGNWVVQDPRGMRGGLFVNRDQALRFVRAENGNRPRDFVMVGGALELDMSRASATAQPEWGATDRRVA